MSINSHDDSRSERTGTNASDVQTEVLSRIEALESTAAESTDPWSMVAGLMAADLFRGRLADQTSIRQRSLPPARRQRD